MKRSCGSCTLCCKTMGVPDHAAGPKVTHKWCPDCKIGVGCGIYETRPTTCREFECVWLQDRMNLFDEDCRPDKTGCVIVPTSDGMGLIAHCDPARPTAWRDERILSRLRRCAKAGYVSGARAGTRYWVVTETAEWEVPPENVIAGPGGKVDVRIPHDVKAKIGLRVNNPDYY